MRKYSIKRTKLWEFFQIEITFTMLDHVWKWWMLLDDSNVWYAGALLPYWLACGFFFFFLFVFCSTKICALIKAQILVYMLSSVYSKLTDRKYFGVYILFINVKNCFDVSLPVCSSNYIAVAFVSKHVLL